MAKRFDIHEWQAKIRLTEQGERGTDVPFGGSRGRSPEWLDAEVTEYIGQTFASWMSPDNPPFAQEYAKPPYIDKLVKGIMNIVNSRDLEEIEVTGMEPDTGNMEKEFKVIGPANQSDPLTDVTIEYKGQEYILDFEFGDVIDDHGNEGRDEWWEATAEDGTYFMVDAYVPGIEMTPEVDWGTLEIEQEEKSKFKKSGEESGFDMRGIDEQNSLGAAGSGASFKAGNSMAHMSKRSFKKKKK